MEPNHATLLTRRRFLQLTGGAAALALLSACVATPAAPATDRSATTAPVDAQPQRGGVLIPYFAPFLQAICNAVQGHTPAPRIVYQNVWLAQG